MTEKTNHTNFRDIVKELVIEAYSKKIKDQQQLQKIKNTYCVKYKISSPANVTLIEAYRDLVKEKKLKESDKFLTMLRKRKVRSLSGIATVTLLTKAWPCPGKCIFCPSEPDMPKSYLSNEPAMMRAILNDFDAYRQVTNRLESLEKTGHPVDKIEVIVAGGTFSAYPKEYQKGFIAEIYNALNNYKQDTDEILSLEESQKLNETADHRCIGLSLETRPDCIDIDEIKWMRQLGATKIEIGIQTLNEKVLELNKRGHGVDAIKDAMKLMKNAGFKINAHIMPNLYGSDLEKDIEMFRELFANPDYCPDWIKIYPCVVTPYSELEKIFKKGEYKPYTEAELVELLIEMKKLVPRYVRITRLFRDIPAESILGGVKISNLRQVIETKMKHKEITCQCIRCREVRDSEVDPENIELKILEYESSGGKEYFLSYEDVSNNKLCSFLRLRIPPETDLDELEGCGLIREIHTFGLHLKIDEDSKGNAVQHKGYGKKLIETAEELVKKNGLKKISVISGIGVREYYKKLNFKLEGTYMNKEL